MEKTGSLSLYLSHLLGGLLALGLSLRKDGISLSLSLLLACWLTRSRFPVDFGRPAGAPLKLEGLKSVN